MYKTRNTWSPIQCVSSSDLTSFMVENILSTDAVATGKINNNFNNKYTDGYISDILCHCKQLYHQIY